MQLPNSGRIALAGLAAVSALGLTACGTDDTPAPRPTSTSSPQTSAVDTPAVPSAADLNAQLQRALDPNVPNAEKLQWIQGAEADPELPGRLAEAYRAANATVEVIEVIPFGDTINAKAKLVFNGQESIADVPFVAENGQWKVQKQWVCQMLELAGQTSTACPA
ncbi:hypothetical protein ACFVMC_22650 [Nocardia sp. NPDC127579]|uniref:hypothetical protein n=1 Tax=Nocardia sp. NPDC127579 TaxID=3345402 RepID=UPI00363D580A